MLVDAPGGGVDSTSLFTSWFSGVDAQPLLYAEWRAEDFDRAWDELDRDPVNQKWQQFMSRLFEPVPGMRSGERFAMMKEVFYLE